MDLTWLTRLLPRTETMWRSFRYKARVRLELGWAGPSFYRLGDPISGTCTVRMIVTASRDEDFVIARGVVEARAHDAREWSVFSPLEEVRHLPETVPKNLEKAYALDGPYLAKGLRVALPGVSAVALRVRIEDYHRVKLTSDPLEVEVAELEKTQTL